MSRVCAKYGRIEEIAQMEATRREDPTTEIGGKKFEPTDSEREIRRIAIDNWKAELRNQADQKALPQGQIPLTITANTSVLEINLIPMEKSTENIVTKENISYKSKSLDQNNRNIPTQPQGDFGEYQANCLIVEQLGVTLINFDRATHGIDNIGIDKEGHYCIFEAKCTVSRDGRSDLETHPLKYKNGDPVKDGNGKDIIMKQAGVDWLTDRLNRMQIPGDELYSKNNTSLAFKIQKDLDQTNGIVNRYLIHTNINTLNMIVSKDHGDGDWQYECAFRSTEKQR